MAREEQEMCRETNCQQGQEAPPEGKMEEAGQEVLEVLIQEKKELEKVIEEVKKENEILRTAAASARADFYNYKNRVERERERYIRLAEEDLVMQLLPVLDNLDRALAQPDNTEEQNIREGVSMVRRQFLSVLEKVGVSEILAEGEPFSPSFHEAVGIEPVEEPEKDGIVVFELQRGYKMADKVIRPSRVKVGKYVEPQKAQECEKDIVNEDDQSKA
ncbi:MAG TPA: nucleotide exchange factor GrpE [Aminobacterium sp.]|jgi:molecular chaperone GrpE (heat shock protein)|uniref:nucleotide exchange factor GrpE n=1 Tax=Aminobacterium TaxID=81466 RepID=UPI0004673475|nr:MULTISPECIES: nucleotide exchange factor GrpE [Aminobacterium]HCA41585.1 nucleotide exchange factor GrpE [Aminobacterium sp.]